MRPRVLVFHPVLFFQYLGGRENMAKTTSQSFPFLEKQRGEGTLIPSRALFPLPASPLPRPRLPRKRLVMGRK